MNPSGDTEFRLDERSLKESALRAQILERCRRTLNHDMNNAVQSIHSGLELLAKSIGSAGIARVTPQECISLLQKQFVSLQNAFRKLLSDVADPAGEPETFDFSVLLAEVLHTLRHERAISKAKVRIDPELSVHARKATLRSITFGVLFDAIDHLPADGTLMITASRRTHLTSLEILVNPATKANRRADQSISVTDLLCSLLNAEGGELRAEETHSGRVLALTIPAARETSAESDSEATTESSPLRVLIADRNRDAADSLAMILQLEGHEAKTIYSGTQLVGTLEAFSPHVVLFDTELPGCDPNEVVSAARAARRGNHALLAQVSSSERTRLAAFDAHLIRPVEWPQLQALLRTTRETS